MTIPFFNKPQRHGVHRVENKRIREDKEIRGAIDADLV
jgi:hypothetical protein